MKIKKNNEGRIKACLAGIFIGVATSVYIGTLIQAPGPPCTCPETFTLEQIGRQRAYRVRERMFDHLDTDNSGHLDETETANMSSEEWYVLRGSGYRFSGR